MIMAAENNGTGPATEQEPVSVSTATEHFEAITNALEAKGALGPVSIEQAQTMYLSSATLALCILADNLGRIAACLEQDRIDDLEYEAQLALDLEKYPIRSEGPEGAD